MPKTPKTTFIPRTSVRKGHETVMGTVTKDPEISPSRKTMVITFRTHAGREFTDRVSTAGNIAIFT